MLKPHIFLIDNFDSFTFNLAYEFQSAGCQVEVWRNNISTQKALEVIESLPLPRLVVISPGPGTPAQAGCCIDLIKQSKGAFPILGVCLGHQAIVEAFGGVVGNAGLIVHGKTSEITHSGEGIFEGLPNPMVIARYHSLVATKLPSDLIETASAGNHNMAVAHCHLPIVGVQFHPESILTTHGSTMITNVIKWAAAL